MLQTLILLFSQYLLPAPHADSCLVSSNGPTYSITVEAVNLSEDMSTLSSRNDELIMLIYEFSDSTKLTAPLFTEYFVLDSIHRVKEFRITISNSTQKVLFVLIEADTGKTPALIEKGFRARFREIINSFLQKDRAGLFKYLDDEDMMGFKVISNLNGLSQESFSFQGRYKLDKFHYKVTLKK